MHGEFRSGLDYFYKAVDAKPDLAQNWINLIKVLVAMRRTDEARQQLEMFRAAEVPGASERDFNRMAGMIDAIQSRPAGQATSNTVAENRE